MTQNLFRAGLLLALSLLANAQFGPPGGGNGNDPYSSSSNPYSDGDGGDGDSGFGQFGPPFNVSAMVTAHAAAATLAFGLLFPVGGIMIRLASFRGLWIVHGLFQIVAYIVFIAAAAMGIYMATHLRVMHNAHPIIGIICLVLLFFQPFLGFVHHLAFKKYSRRVVWSYAHLWLGRIVITLGIINGGLGLQLAKRIGHFAPKESTIIGYSVAASVIWLIYVASAIYGENKRRKAKYVTADKAAPPPYTRENASDSSGGQHA